MKFTKDGVLLADVPNAGATKVDPNAKSGNPRHDVRSGKFGQGPTTEEQNKQNPANVDPVEYARMLDAVRDMAREFDSVDVGDIKEFLAGRARKPDLVDIEAFQRLVMEQRKSDLVDMLDSAMRSFGSLSQGRRKVRLVAPRGFVKRAMRQMDDAAMAEIAHRLEARGHDSEDVKRFFEGRVKNIDSVLESKKSIAASEQWESEIEGEINWNYLENFDEEPDDKAELADVVREAISSIPAPVVNLTLPSGKKIIHRDPKTHLITHVEEEDASIS